MFSLIFRLFMNFVWGAMFGADVIKGHNALAAVDVVVAIIFSGVYVWTIRIERDIERLKAKTA